MSYQKKGGRGHARPSFFWYDNDSGHYGPFPVTQPIHHCRINRHLSGLWNISQSLDTYTQLYSSWHWDLHSTGLPPNCHKKKFNDFSKTGYFRHKVPRLFHDRITKFHDLLIDIRLVPRYSTAFPWPHINVSPNPMTFPEITENFKIPQIPWFFHDHGNPVVSDHYKIYKLISSSKISSGHF